MNSNSFFELAKQIVHGKKYICTECGHEYDDLQRRCTIIVEPETSDLFEVLCDGKVEELEQSIEREQYEER